MIKKVLSILLAIVIISGIFTTFAIAADDKPSSWAEKEVTAAITAKLVPQSLQSKYTQPTTRAEFCALAVTLYENIKGKAITERKTFSDTKDINVEKAGGIGVATALSEGKFYPTAKITREHVAIMTARLANALGKPLPKNAPTYDDKSSISSSAVESVGQVQAAGLMVEAGYKKFAPKDSYTREQSIVTIMRTFDIVKLALPSPTTQANETIDPAIQGHWQYKGVGNLRDTISWNDWYYYDFVFNEDGSFKYFYQNYLPSASLGAITVKTQTEGKYTVSNGKVYLTEILYERGTENEAQYGDRTFEYEIGKDDIGVYLNIGSSLYLTDDNMTYIDISLAVKYRIYSDIYFE